MQPSSRTGIVGAEAIISEALLTRQAIVFGRYQLHRLLGAGEHGSVYRATLTGDSAPVALRLLSARLADDPGFAARLEAFAGSLATLAHPALNPALDWGIVSGQPFLVTTLEPGTPLDRVDPSEVDLASRVGLIADAFDAVAVLHQAGIVHGDLRPSNVALRADGRAGITDTALARWLGAPLPVGNPYLSPECANGAPVNAAADCYALGVILYQLLTGVLPADPPLPPSSLRPDLPVALDAIALRLVARDPDSRFPTAEAAAKALGPFAKRRVPIAEPPPHHAAVREPAASSVMARLGAQAAALPRPPLAASALTALLLGILTAATIVGTGRAAARPGPIDTFLRPAEVVAEPPPAVKPMTPTLPVVAALPPPVVVTSTGALSMTSAAGRTISGTAAITNYGTLSSTRPITASPSLSATAPVSGMRPSTPITPASSPSAPAQSNPDSLMYVVSNRQGVPENYQPADLVPIDGLIPTVKPNVRLRRVVLDAFRRMTDAMRAAGLEPIVFGAYLSPPEQREAFAKLVSQYGQAGAERLGPKPGFDEHQLGTVVDFVSGSQGRRLDDRFNESPEGRWLLANAPKYGFIPSYPVGKDAVIGFKARPWQYRYVGDLAYDIASRGQTLEEYVAARR
ncbi:MAG: hypothetical protein KatS3mg060_1410 [Dehalococcoidia bacterium]|nr:MAG: hypothetical protein KatS3mg060_1410 [Dehalococcoidia bacterium]